MKKLDELKTTAINEYLFEEIKNKFKEEVEYLNKYDLLTDNLRTYEIDNFLDIFIELKQEFSTSEYFQLYNNNEVLEIYNDDTRGDIDESYRNFINELGKENAGDSIIECMRIGIHYYIEQEVNNYDINSSIDILLNNYIEELKEKINEIDEDFNEEEFIENFNSIENDDFFNAVLNNKLNRKLITKEIKTKTVKI